MSKGIITLCGSTRFYADFKEANLRLTLNDYIVLSIGVDTRSDKDIPELNDPHTSIVLKERLDRLHKEKIDMSDAIMVIDIDGYVGESTRSEIKHAYLKGKKIYSYTLSKKADKYLSQLVGMAPIAVALLAVTEKLGRYE
jgi:hypothetical protein